MYWLTPSTSVCWLGALLEPVEKSCGGFSKTQQIENAEVEIIYCQYSAGRTASEVSMMRNDLQEIYTLVIYIYS